MTTTATDNLRWKRLLIVASFLAGVAVGGLVDSWEVNRKYGVPYWQRTYEVEWKAIRKDVAPCDSANSNQGSK